MNKTGAPAARAPRRMPVRTRVILYAVLLATLGLLLAHAYVYAFLTDDAFISFRYARNLSQGNGLVFNPGFERVEGYTNFLWVLVLAAFNAAGFASEHIAHVLTVTVTVVLWLLVVWCALRSAARGRQVWIAVVPALFLAATRSVAVWSTSGLETRLFEVLIVGGTLRLIVEIQAHISGEKPPRPLAAVLLALASLTRPDGVLISLAAIAGMALRFRGRLGLRLVLVSLGIYVFLVAGHFAFRLVYYGEWLPNTYYAKVGGRTSWDLGFAYLAAVILEYAAYLWLPILVAALFHHRTRATLFIPALFGAVVIPHALYVTAVGGDHFEYRPFDLYFPFAFLLMADGVRHVARARASSIGVATYLALVLIGLFELPYQSHRQFPNEYISGFPGKSEGSAETEDFLLPQRDPIYRWPGLRHIAAAHRDLQRTLTANFACVRQEEHRLFLAEADADGLCVRRLIDQELVPQDVHIAIPSVGAIPYVGEFRALDRTGLTDKGVAKQESAVEGWMAHGKNATLEYMQAAGVDLVSIDVHVTWPVEDRRFAAAYLAAEGAADVGDGRFLLGRFPSGLDAAKQRFPSLGLQRPTVRSLYDIARSLKDDGKAAAAQPLFAAALQWSMRLLPEDHPFIAVARAGYGDCLADNGRHAEAERQLLAAFSTVQTELGNAHAATRRLAEKLVRLYEAWGRTDEAEKYRNLRAGGCEASGAE